MFIWTRAEEILRADDAGEEGFRRRVALEYRILRTLLVIDDELRRDPGVARPLRELRRRVVADQLV